MARMSTNKRITRRNAETGSRGVKRSGARATNEAVLICSLNRSVAHTFSCIPCHPHPPRAMAKLVLVIAVLLVASAWEAGAHNHPVKVVPDVFSLKCIVHNVADRCVTVGISSGDEGQEVAAEPGCWTPIGPIDVICSSPVVHFCVTVTNDKGFVVSKSFPLNLLAQFELIEPKFLKTLAITTCERFGPDGSKCIDFKIGREKLASLPL